MNQKRTANLLTVLMMCLVLLLTACGKDVQDIPLPDKNEEVAETSKTEPIEETAEQTESSPQEETDTVAEPSGGKTVEEMLAEQGNDLPTVEIGENTYALRGEVSCYLVMGIDKEGIVSGEDLIGGQCDLIQLLVVDEGAKRYTTLQIHRDTMTEVDVLDYTGERTGVTAWQQICFAHTYGNGTEASCENVVRAVSRLLGGIEIDGYVAMQYDGIPTINDTLGDIYVTIEDDFSQMDATLIQGETVELEGQHALNYVRGRRAVGDGSNTGRMRRQKTYQQAFSQRLQEELRGNSAIINDLYHIAEPYMVTDMSVGAMSNLAVRIFGYTDGGIVSLPGTTQSVLYENGNSYVEFQIDENAMKQLMVELFYMKNS